MPREDLWKLIELKHPHEVGIHKTQTVVAEMNRMRTRVRLLLPGEADIQGRHVALRPEEALHRHTIAGIIRRLNRDRPDLAAGVAAREFSANAAAIEAGFRKKLTPYEQIIRLLPQAYR
jgi:hypothetical protein